MPPSFGLEYPLAAALVFTVLCVWTLRAYARTVPPLPRSRRLLLSGLRLTASLLLALMLGAASATLTRVQEEATPLRILLDASASMSRPAERTENPSEAPTRYERALATVEQIRERWADRLDLSIQAFGLALREGEPPRTAAEAGTDLGAVLNSLPTPRPGESVLLLSDGRDTEGSLWASELSASLPVHCVLFGDTLRPADLRIERVDVLPVGHKGVRLPLTVQISSQGDAARSGRIRLYSGETILAEQDWELDPDVDHLDVQMPLVMEETGQHLLSLRVEGDTDADVAPENNERLVPLRIVEGKLRILVLAGRPDWDLAAFMRALAGEEALELTLVTADVDGGLRESAGGAVWRPQEQEYHGLVLHSLHRAWPRDLLSSLRVRGGAFLMGGYVSEERASALARDWSLSTVSRAPVKREVLADWGAGATRHPAVQGLRASGLSPRELAPLEASIPNPLGGGRALLQDDQRPILTARDLGGQRLVVSSARGFWRWPLHDEAGGLLLERLYSALVRWLAREDPPDRLVVSWPEEGVLAGRAGILEGEVFDSDFVYQSGAELSWNLRGGDSLLLRGSFQERAGAERYEARLPSLPEGVYRLELTARTAGGEELRRELDLPVLPPEREMLYPAASAETLRWLAGRSGGIFQPAPDLDALEGVLDFTPQRRSYTRAVKLWQHPLSFILLLILLALEWGLRKRFGMV